MRSPRTIVTGILVILVGIEAVSLIEQILAPDVTAREFSMQVVLSTIYQFLVPLSPVLILLIIYFWVGRLILRLLSRNGLSNSIYIRFHSISRFLERLPVSWDGQNVPLLGSPLAVLLVGMASACILAIMPYRPDVNPAGIPVGADTSAYIFWVNQMLQKSIPDGLVYAFRQASNGDRPLSLIIPYVMSGIFGVQSDATVKFYPLFLGPLLVVSTFLFVSLGFGDKHTAGLVGLMTAFSFQLTVGMWAGYYANWLALAESFLLMGFLLRWISLRSKRDFICTVSLSIVVLFTHPWTWDFMLLLSTSFMIERIVATHDFKLMRAAILFVAIGIAADSVKSFVVGGYGGGRAAVDIATTSIGLPQLVAFWPNVVATFVQYYSMLLADSVILGLAAIAMWRFSASDHDFARLVVLWVAMASLPFPFLGSLLQSRIIYLLPIPLLSTGAVLGLQRLGQGRTQQALILLVILLFSANHALSSMFQL